MIIDCHTITPARKRDTLLIENASETISRGIPQEKTAMQEKPHSIACFRPSGPTRSAHVVHEVGNARRFAVKLSQSSVGRGDDKTAEREGNWIPRFGACMKLHCFWNKTLFIRAVWVVSMQGFTVVKHAFEPEYAPGRARALG